MDVALVRTRLSKNHWRMAWVVLADSAIIFWLVTAPIREYHNRTELYRLLETPQPPLSFWAQFANPWLLTAVLALAIGILAEISRSVFSLLFNTVPFVLFSGWWVIDRARSPERDAEALAYAFPLAAAAALIVVVNGIFYLIETKNLRAKNLPSRPS